MSVVVLSAVYGNYDDVAPAPKQTIDAEWILVTDREGPAEVAGWRVIIEQRQHMHQRLAAKVPKCLPWYYTNAETTVWMDASCHLLVPDALEQIIAGVGDGCIAQVVHPWRDDIADEAAASEGMPKYAGQPVVAQAQHYIDHGHPRNAGLWATGLIVRRASSVHRQRLMDFGRRWLAEQVIWSYQDQISEAPILRYCGLGVTPLLFPLHGSGVFEWLNHRDEW